MPEKIRWGILSTGHITHKFAADLVHAPDAELMAVGSRSQESAERFGAAFNVPKRHASYEALAADPDVDVIYVATPHPYHYETAMICLQAGKHVLLEKPFTLNAGQAERLIAYAREQKLFLMEAMWTRFFPLMATLRRVLAEGAIGPVKLLQADFSFRSQQDQQGRHFNPELGGGAMLDIGIYPISMAYFLLGTPLEVRSQAILGPTGTDDQSSYIFTHADSALSTLTASLLAESPRVLAICGEQGHITLEGRWHQPARFKLSENGHNEVIEAPYQGEGYYFEAKAVMDCIRSGKTEHDLMPLDESLAIMRVMDGMRASWGLRYPGD